MPKRRSIKKKIPAINRAAFAIAMTALAASANAQYDYWTNPLGGSWENPANWSGDKLPVGPVFNLATSTPFTVSLDAKETVGGTLDLNNSLPLM